MGVKSDDLNLQLKNEEIISSNKEIMLQTNNELSQVVDSAGKLIHYTH